MSAENKPEEKEGIEGFAEQMDWSKPKSLTEGEDEPEKEGIEGYAEQEDWSKPKKI